MATGAAAQSQWPRKHSVEQVIKDMEAAYRKAENYSDHGQVRRRFTKDGQTFEHDFDFTAAFSRPNKLRLEVYRSAGDFGRAEVSRVRCLS